MNPASKPEVTDVIDIDVKTTRPEQPSANATAASNDFMGIAKDWWARHGGGLNAVADEARQGATQVGQRARDYIQQEPVKAVAIAAAAGMVFSALMGARGRSKATEPKGKA